MAKKHRKTQAQKNREEYMQKNSQTLKAFSLANKLMERPLKLEEGELVMLNYEKITSSKGYYKTTPEYKAFVEANKCKTFTVEFDEQHYKTPSLVCFKEDDKPIKSLWHEGDLIRVEVAVC